MLGFLYVCLVGYVVQGTVFSPIGGGIQGRHLLPAFSLLPILAGVVLHEKVSVAGGRRRLFGFVAVVVGAVQVFSVMVNGRRYAVGVDGPAVFLAEAHWAPRGGWLLWLLIALAAGVWLAVVIYRSGRPEPIIATGIDGEPVGSPDSATDVDDAQPTLQLTLL